MARDALPILALLLASILVLDGVFPGASGAGEPSRWLRKPVAQPRFHPEYVIGYDPYGPTGGYSVPTYRWGYFGVGRSRPWSYVRHTGYRGNYLQWKWYRGH